jgi:hypothetical protein
MKLRVVARLLLTASGLVPALPAGTAPLAPGLPNPVWVSTGNLRDPSVLVVEGGYQISYSRLVGPNWASPDGRRRTLLPERSRPAAGRCFPAGAGRLKRIPRRELEAARRDDAEGVRCRHARR